MTERTYTTEQAAKRLGVPAGRIAEWKHRDRIYPAGWTNAGHPLYLLDDLEPLAREWAKRSARRAATRRSEG